MRHLLLNQGTHLRKKGPSQQAYLPYGGQAADLHGETWAAMRQPPDALSVTVCGSSGEETFGFGERLHSYLSLSIMVYREAKHAYRMTPVASQREGVSSALSTRQREVHMCCGHAALRRGQGGGVNIPNSSHHGVHMVEGTADCTLYECSSIILQKLQSLCTV